MTAALSQAQPALWHKLRCPPREALDLVEQLQALRVQPPSQLVGFEDHAHRVCQLVQAGLVL